MPDDIPNPAPEASAEVVDATEDLGALLKEATNVFKEVGGKLAKLLEEGVKLHPVEAVKQIPEAASEVASGAGAAAGEGAQAAGHAVAAVPAVATDTLDTAQAAGGAVAKKTRHYTLRKRR